MFVDRMRYELQVMGKKVIFTPILVMLGFTIVAIIMEASKADKPTIARFLAASVEMILPMATGIIVATISTQDSALELQLTMPREYHLTAIRRLSIIVIWTAFVSLFASIILEVFGLWRVPVQMESWNAFLQIVVGALTWIAPMLWFVGVGLCIALLIRSRSACGAILGGIWIIEIIAKDFFIVTNWLSPTFLFAIVFAPDYAFWLPNRWELIGTAVVLLVIGWIGLHGTEGLLKGTSEE